MRNTKLIIIFSSLAFIAVVIILSSVVFSIRHVDVYCYNADDSDFSERVLDAAEIKKGNNIFFLSEKNVIKKLSNNMTDAKPINIERKFPNRVQINVVKRIAHSYYVAGGSYYILDPEGKILDITDADGYESYKYVAVDNTSYELIELRLDGNVGGEIGGFLSGGENNEIEVYKSLLSAFEKVDYREFDVIALLDYIDLRDVESELILAETKVYNTALGTIFKILGSGGLDRKVRDAVSFFLASDKHRTNHIITASNVKTTVRLRTGTDEDYK